MSVDRRFRAVPLSLLPAIARAADRFAEALIGRGELVSAAQEDYRVSFASLPEPEFIAPEAEWERCVESMPEALRRAAAQLLIGPVGLAEMRPFLPKSFASLADSAVAEGLDIAQAPVEDF